MRGKGPARTGGTEMAILLGVLLLLVVLVLVFWKIRSGEKQEAEQRKEEKTRAHRNNVALAYKVWQEAYNAGKNFVTGADTKLTKEDLAKVFGGRQEVYNVLLIRHYKAKKGKDEEARLELDSSRLTVNKVGSPELREGISIYYGTAEGNTVPIAIAEKHINVEEGDKVNTGGEITVIVRAEEEIKPGSITDPKAK